MPFTKFKTKLKPLEEKEFQKWFLNYAKVTDNSPDPDDPQHMYNYREYFKNHGPTPVTPNMHLPDTYKYPGHPTYYIQDPEYPKSEHYKTQSQYRFQYGGYASNFLPKFPLGGETPTTQPTNTNILKKPSEVITPEEADIFDYSLTGDEDVDLSSYILPVTNISSKLGPGVLERDYILANIDKLILPNTLKVRKNLNNKFSNIHKNSNKNCLAGSLNCNQQYLFDEILSNAKQSDFKPVRTLIANNLAQNESYKEDLKSHKQTVRNTAGFSEYSIPSSDNRWDFSNVYHNSSIDSWEMPHYLVGEGLGKYVPLEYKKGKLTTDLAIGDLLFLQRDLNYYTNTNDPTHTVTVVGFYDTGEPILYDYGNATTLNKLSNNYFQNNLHSVVRMNGYADKNLTFQTLLDKKNKLNSSSEEYKGMFSSINPNLSKKEKKVVDRLTGSLEKSASAIAEFYSLEPEVIKKLSKRVFGIGIKETGLNQNINLNDSGLGTFIDITTDSGISGAGKSGIKWVKGKYNKFKEKNFEKREIKSDWKIESELFREKGYSREQFQNLSEEEKNEFKKEYLYRRNEVYGEPTDKGKDVKASAGPFKIKNLPAYASAQGVKKNDLRGIFESDKIEKGSEIALAFLAENYRKLAIKNPDLTIDELINLTTVSYNSYSKSMDEEFINFYIKEKNLDDDYLKKTKEYEDYIFNNEPLLKPEVTNNSPTFEFGGNINKKNERVKTNIKPYKQVKEEKSKPKQMEYPSFQPRIKELLEQLELKKN